MARYKIQSIGREKAVALFKSGWWKERSAREIAKFQLSTEELTLPFDIYQTALGEALGRPVFTHELQHNDELLMELFGEKDAPTLQEIIEQIPEAKRVLIEKGDCGEDNE